MSTEEAVTVDGGGNVADTGGNVADNNASNSSMSQEDIAALTRMHAEVKRNLKGLSKNELIRIVANQLVELFILRKNIERLSSNQEIKGE